MKKKERHIDERNFDRIMEWSRDNPKVYFDNKKFIKYPFSKRLELAIDGTTPTYVRFQYSDFVSILVNSKKQWAFPVGIINDVFITHRFDTSKVEYGVWGATGASQAALTNGIYIGYTLDPEGETFNNELFSNAVIQDNGDMLSIFHDFQVNSGEAASPTTIIRGLWHAHETLSPGIMLDFTRKDNFWALIQDDLTNANYGTTDLNIRVQGYGWVRR